MKKTKETKKNEGITLIALVITIIVLILLAGVGISTLTGNNGTLLKAQDAKIMSALGKVNEAIEIKRTEKKLEKSNEGDHEAIIEDTDLEEEGIFTTIDVKDTTRRVGVVKKLSELGVSENLRKKR